MPTMTPMEKSLLLRQAERLADFAANRWGSARIGGPSYTANGTHGDWSVIVAGLRDDVEMEKTRVWIDGTEERLPGETPTMTAGQDRAFAFLNDRYGDCRVMAADRALVKLEGIDDDGEVRARWFVEPDGRVNRAWDPDGALDIYEARA